MTKKQYNIIWGDDQIKEVLTDDLRDFLDSLQIKVINESTNAEDLGIFLRSNADKIDAVITDANYSRDRNNKVNPDPNSELITGGLQYVMTLREMYPNKPFFICTQRKLEKLRERFNDGELKPFEGKIFDKTMEDYEIFFPEIVKEIEKRETPEFIIRNRFDKELAAIKFTYSYEKSGKEIASNAEKDVLQWLVDDYMGNLGGTHNFLNPLRRIFERLMETLIVRGIIPNISVNNFCRMINTKQDYDNEIIRKPNWIEQRALNSNNVPGHYLLTLEGWRHIPPTIGRIVSFFLDLTNDASHDTEVLDYGVVGYINKTTTGHNVFRTALYSLLEIISWYESIMASYSEGLFKGLLWISDPTEFWYKDSRNWWCQDSVLPVDIEEDAEGNWYSGNVLIKENSIRAIKTNTPLFIDSFRINDSPLSQDKYPLVYDKPVPGLVVPVERGYQQNLSVCGCCSVHESSVHVDDIVVLNSVTDATSNSSYPYSARISIYRENDIVEIREENGYWVGDDIIFKKPTQTSVAFEKLPSKSVTIHKLRSNKESKTKNIYPYAVAHPIPGFTYIVKDDMGAKHISNFLVEQDEISQDDVVVLKAIKENPYTDSLRKKYIGIAIVEKYMPLEENTAINETK